MPNVFGFHKIKLVLPEKNVHSCYYMTGFTIIHTHTHTYTCNSIWLLSPVITAECLVVISLSVHHSYSVSHLCLHWTVACCMIPETVHAV